MNTLRQILLCMIVLIAGLYVWITYVPAAQPLLARTGILDLLGIEVAQAPQAEQNGGRRGGGAARVIAEIVGEKALEERVSAIGDGRALRSVTVRSNAVGVITDVAVTAGAYVNRGDIIIKLLDEKEQIALEQARIELDDARAEATRIRELEATGATTAVRLREAVLALRRAELAERQAAFDLSQRQIAAPISGWAGFVELEEGDRVNAQDVLVTISDRSDILIDFRVPERIVPLIALGQTFDVVPLGQPDMTLTGTISAIDSTVDRASRTLLVQGRVSNEADQLRAGMAFSINLNFAGPTVLSIAPLAVQWSSEGPFVWAVRDAKAVRVTVAMAQRNSDEVLVTSEDLSAGDMVVTEGVQTLRDGADVTLSGPQEGAAVLPDGAKGAKL